jgi:hypothetical protein
MKQSNLPSRHSSASVMTGFWLKDRDLITRRTEEFVSYSVKPTQLQLSSHDRCFPQDRQEHKAKRSPPSDADL